MSWAASAVPLQTAKPAAPDAKIAIADEVTAPGEPKLVHKVKPGLPGRREGGRVQGLFLIDVVIGKDGAIKDARVAASAPTVGAALGDQGREGGRSGRRPTEGDARLAEAALDAVKQWRYEPILKDGKPVDVRGHRDRELQAPAETGRSPAPSATAAAKQRNAAARKRSGAGNQ